MEEKPTAYELHLDNVLAKYGLKHAYGWFGENVSSHYIVMEKKRKFLGIPCKSCKSH